MYVIYSISSLSLVTTSGLPSSSNNSHSSTPNTKRVFGLFGTIEYKRADRDFNLISEVKELEVD